MKMSKTYAAVLAVLAVGCGGGTEPEYPEPESSATSVPPPSFGTTTVKSGVITGFGSVYIDGKRFTTDSASISVNGTSGESISSLKVGMKILMAATEDDDSAVASSISYDEDVNGIIQSINRTTNTIIVAGIRISFDDLTHFVQTSVATLEVGQRIEVSGYAMADGSFYASYIETESSASQESYETISGVVANLDDVTMTFLIGDTIVNFASALLKGEVSEGQFVKVEGHYTNGVFDASELESKLFEETGDGLDGREIEGVITQLDTNNQVITLYGQQFDYSTSTVFEGGSESDLSVGGMVELYISYSNSEPTITKIEIKSNETVDGKVKGVVSAIDFEAGTLTVNSVVYLVTDTTRYEDDNDQYFSLSSIQVNDKVEIVYKTVGGDNILLRIEHEAQSQFEEQSELKGYVSSVLETSVTVAGLTIDFGADALYLIDDRVVTFEEFKAQLEVGSKLEIEGQYNTQGEFIAGTFELENTYDDMSDSDEGSSSESGNDDDDNNEDFESDLIGTYLETEGRVSAIISEIRFIVNGYEVDISNAKKLSRNDTRLTVEAFMTALKVNDVVEVEGTVVNNNVITAYEVEVEDD